MEDLIKEFGIEKLRTILENITVENTYDGEKFVVNKVYAGVDGMTIYVEDVEDE